VSEAEADAEPEEDDDCEPESFGEGVRRRSTGRSESEDCESESDDDPDDEPDDPEDDGCESGVFCCEFDPLSPELLGRCSTGRSESDCEPEPDPEESGVACGELCGEAEGEFDPLSPELFGRCSTGRSESPLEPEPEPEPEDEVDPDCESGVACGEASGVELDEGDPLSPERCRIGRPSALALLPADGAGLAEGSDLAEATIGCHLPRAVQIPPVCAAPAKVTKPTGFPVFCTS